MTPLRTTVLIGLALAAPAGCHKKADDQHEHEREQNPEPAAPLKDGQVIDLRGVSPDQLANAVLRMGPQPSPPPAPPSPSGLSTEEIDRVIKAHAGAFRACYQKGLDHSPDLAGKVVIHFEIAADGKVKTAAVKETTLHNGNVEDCLLRQVGRLVFPPKGPAIVN
ncbi:MAG TPA: AgmX/PglI C-terminal domain-containing protein, partial [Kofleriaceae bacterium]|nr:AgmX/PglI C-terminal domain-containing protein [Kofleriaceae bacterium]